jgi:transcriptional antiterminator RfaH
LYPEGLFDGASRSAPEGHAWRVLHTKPRQEKSLARELWRGRLPFYLPLVVRRSLVRGRPVQAHVPLFPGYLFLLSGREQCLGAMATKRVVRALEVKDRERLEGDLRQVFRLIASGAPVTPEPRLVAGATVEIRHGALAGLKGEIVRAASGNRFVVQVDFIQQGASVQLDDFYLEVVGKAGVREEALT